MREKQVLRVLEQGVQAVPAMVAAMYRELDPRLHSAAARSVLAHLIDLQNRGLARSEGEAWTLSG
jgi:hypothetical protein